MGEEKLVPKLRFAGFNETWEKYNLIDVINEFYNGQTPSRSNLSYWNGNIPWTSVSDLNYGFITDTLEKITTSGKESANLKILPKNTFIIAIVGLEAKGTRGSCALLGVDSTINQACVALIPNKNKLNHHFMVQWYLNVGDKYGIKYTQGTKQQNYNIDLLKKLPIIIPSNMQEQNKIGLFLFKVDEKIRLLKEKMEVYISFKKYLMQQIFAQKLRFDKTSEWETFALNDIGKTYNGLSGLSKDNFEKGNSKYITYKSIFDNNILKSDFTENVDLNNKSQNEVKKGDLFFTGSSETPEEVGMVSVLSSTVENCYLNSFCFGFRLNNNHDVNPLFLAYYLRSPIMRNKIMILAQGSTRFNLSKKEILKLKVKIPLIGEQQQIIDLFQNVDNKINEISMQTDNFKNFKKGLLQQMFV